MAPRHSIQTVGTVGTVVDMSMDVSHNLEKATQQKGTQQQSSSLSCIYAMKHSKAALVILFCTVLFIGCGQNSDRTAVQPDNTSVNARDRSSAEPTADQQHENTTDRELTQRIRQSVMADESFSTYAKNIKIISENGMVTLKGPVASDQEKRSIVAMAVSATGDAAKVTDQISVDK